MNSDVQYYIGMVMHHKRYTFDFNSSFNSSAAFGLNSPIVVVDILMSRAYPSKSMKNSTFYLKA